MNTKQLHNQVGSNLISTIIIYFSECTMAISMS